MDSGTLTGILFIGFIIILIVLRRRRTKQAGFEYWQTVFRGELAYIKGAIPDEYYYRLDALGKTKMSGKQCMEHLQEISEEMDVKGIDTTPITALMLKIRADMNEPK